jgi:hypothetical protein
MGSPIPGQGLYKGQGAMAAVAGMSGAQEME